MESILKADIFFFVTTIAVLVFLVLGSIATVHLIGILKNVKYATRKMNTAIDSAEEEIDVIKNRIAESFIFNFIFGKAKKKGTHKATKN